MKPGNGLLIGRRNPAFQADMENLPLFAGFLYISGGAGFWNINSISMELG